MHSPWTDLIYYVLIYLIFGRDQFLFTSVLSYYIDKQGCIKITAFVNETSLYDQEGLCSIPVDSSVIS